MSPLLLERASFVGFLYRWRIRLGDARKISAMSRLSPLTNWSAPCKLTNHNAPERFRRQEYFHVRC